MNFHRKISSYIGVAIVSLVISVAAVGFFVVRADLDALGQAGEENILWDAVQLEIELMRFQHALSDYASDNEVTTPTMVNDRFDILWSRISLYQQGKVGRRLNFYDAEDQTVKRLFALMQDVETGVVALGPNDRDLVAPLLARFEPFQMQLRELSRRVLHGEEARNAGQRDNLVENAKTLGFLSAAAVFASVLMVIIFARETGRYRRLAEENRVLLEGAKEASKAKSAFLAMMSHELRTPLNGVLGLLALIAQGQLPSEQRNLLKKAELSGRQMNTLLADILDFSALQDNQLDLVQKPLEPAAMLAELEAMFAPLAQAADIEFTTHLAEDCPAWVIGDSPRLRQSLVHFIMYLLETAGIHRVELRISYSLSALKLEIGFDYASDGGGWSPELIMGTAAGAGPLGKNAHPDRHFASEALGPAVSRGLIAKMEGDTQVQDAEDGRGHIIVTVPAQKFDVETLSVRIVTNSSSLETICKAAFLDAKIEFLPGEDSRAPHVVLIESGGDQEALHVAQNKSRFPRALLVALGRPHYPDGFDGVIPLPVDAALVRSAGFMAMVQG